jgi:hypothetical protein
VMADLWLPDMMNTWLHLNCSVNNQRFSWKEVPCYFWDIRVLKYIFVIWNSNLISCPWILLAESDNSKVGINCLLKFGRFYFRNINLHLCLKNSKIWQHCALVEIISYMDLWISAQIFELRCFWSLYPVALTIPLPGHCLSLWLFL